MAQQAAVGDDVARFGEFVVRVPGQRDELTERQHVVARIVSFSGPIVKARMERITQQRLTGHQAELNMAALSGCEVRIVPLQCLSVDRIRRGRCADVTVH